MGKELTLRERDRRSVLKQKNKVHLKRLQKNKALKKKVAERRNGLESVAYLKTMTYHEFLNSNYWEKVRREVLARDNNMCIICKSTENLQIHHDSYKHHFNELENIEDLMTLCRVCHKEHHFAQS